jgi:hypothetical protein
MHPAMLLMVLVIALVASVHEYARPARKIYSLLGLSLAIVAAAVALIVLSCGRLRLVRTCPHTAPRGHRWRGCTVGPG